MTRNLRRGAVLASALALPLALAACGSSSTGSTSTPMSATPMSSSAMPASSPTAMAASDQVFGSACSAVPASGPGSFDGMATDPVATAASHNPVLSTLVTAVSKAGLVDSLNTAQGITVFAPTNDAFTALGTKTVDAALADPKGLLTKVLTYHVVAGRLSPSDLAGTHKTLEGATITVAGSGDSFTVNGSAKVVCGNVPTANATVYLIDGVLLPKS
ncbi:MAG TPA: fasciclin domain-containing protein [Candidatus Nanopelagicales bacterium]|nr:fasciclin domain-containing protein [Candidatus Nanopelagicales bacterium]